MSSDSEEGKSIFDFLRSDDGQLFHNPVATKLLDTNFAFTGLDSFRRLARSLKEEIASYLYGTDFTVVEASLIESILPLILPVGVQNKGFKMEFQFHRTIYDKFPAKLREIAYLHTLIGFTGNYPASFSPGKHDFDALKSRFNTKSFISLSDDSQEVISISMIDLTLIAFLELRLDAVVVGRSGTAPLVPTQGLFPGAPDRSWLCEEEDDRHIVEDALESIYDCGWESKRSGIGYYHRGHPSMHSLPLCVPNDVLWATIRNPDAAKLEEEIAKRGGYAKIRPGDYFGETSLSSGCGEVIKILEKASSSAFPTEIKQGETQLASDYSTFTQNCKYFWDNLCDEQDTTDFNILEGPIVSRDSDSVAQIFDYSKFDYKSTTIQEDRKYKFSIETIKPPSLHHASLPCSCELFVYLLTPDYQQGISDVQVEVFYEENIVRIETEYHAVPIM